ncbi:MAG: restriction endonuclease subunit S, partial [Bacteroidota bacterium]
MRHAHKNAATNEEPKPSLVPRLRFPDFEGEWETRSGDDLFDQISERNPGTDLPVLAITQEHGAIPRHMIEYHVSVTEKSIESYKLVRRGDFIISLRSFQGGIEYSHYNGLCSPAYVILRRSREGSNEYYKQYLKTDRFILLLTRNLEGLRDGKMISYRQFSELRLPIPKSAEQQRIASCLSSLDELIGAQARKVDALKTHKKGLMQQLFPREGETLPRLRFPEFEGEWEERRLGDVATFHKG